MRDLWKTMNLFCLLACILPLLAAAAPATPPLNFEKKNYNYSEWAKGRFSEAVTLIADDHVPDSVYEEVRPFFDFRELSALTLAIASSSVFASTAAVRRSSCQSGGGWSTR